VIDAATAQLAAVFGELGRSPRTVIGASVLPYNAPVLLELTFAIDKAA
jgi:hypothetical protein